jgi:hypothetical protein
MNQIFKKHIKLLSSLTGLLFSIFWINTSLGQATSDGSVARLSFGRVMPDEPIEEVIGFNNPGDEPLVVENIQLTPPLLAEDITYLILPGAEGSFKLVLGEDRQPGPFEGVVRINFKDARHSPITFEIEGFVIPPIEFKPYPAFFVATHSGKQKTASIEIINHREQPLLLTTVKSDSERFSAELETIETGQHYRLTLILDGVAKPGKKEEEIILLTDQPMEKPLRVQANTIIRERVYTFPETVDLGNLPLKVVTENEAVQTLAQTLMVYRPETSDFDIDTSVNLDYLRLDSERGPNGDRYQLTLTLIPEKVVPGKIEGVVSIKTNDKEFSVLEVPVSGYILDR